MKISRVEKKRIFSLYVLLQKKIVSFKLSPKSTPPTYEICSSNQFIYIYTLSGQFYLFKICNKKKSKISPKTLRQCSLTKTSFDGLGAQPLHLRSTKQQKRTFQLSESTLGALNTSPLSGRHPI